MPIFKNSPKTKSVFLLCSLVIFIVLTQWSRLKIPLTGDEGVFTCVAQEMNSGRKLYQDVWDHKPPLLFLQFVLIQKLFSMNEVNLHLYVIFIHCLNAGLIFLLARRLKFSLTGSWFSAFFYAGLIIPPLFQSWTAQADLLMQPFLILSFYASFSEKSYTQFLTGVLWGAAFFTKQSALFFLPALVLNMGVKNISKMAFFIVGVDLIAVVVVLPFWLDGRLPLFWNALTGFNQNYVENGWQMLLYAKPFQDYKIDFLKIILWVYGLPLAVFFFIRRKPLEKIRTSYFLMIWFFCGLMACCASGYLFSYYFLVLLPPMALALGYGWMRWSERKETRLTLYFALITLWVLCFAINLFSVNDFLLAHSGCFINRNNAAKAVGLYLNGIAEPQDRLLAWTTEPQIYTYSGLKMAVVTTPLINHLSVMPEAFEKARMNFIQEPPRYCVVSRFSQVFGIPLWLKNALAKKYVMTKTFESFDLYQLSK